ncbi:MAG: DUF4352 domain-containing protein [Anaerobacillus sp.]|uniref:DUF4352 domain-containing protein n=1 Tax=Anaerobacillus sp. TaxID=1872506 RepID=UPI00391B0366
MKKLFTILLALTLLTTVGCGDKPSEGTTTEPTSTSKETKEKTDKVDKQNKALKLGETGRMKSTLGEFDVTVNSFEILEEYDGTKPYFEVFIAVDVTIENIGDFSLNSWGITRTRLENVERGSGTDNEGIDFPEEILPGETVSGIIYFDNYPYGPYELIFGFARSSVSSKLTWTFDVSEVSNK